jgi:hypothetical protein
MEKQLTYTQYVALHPNCSFEQFNKETGGSKQCWYSARYLIRKRLRNPKNIKIGRPVGAKNKKKAVVQTELFVAPPEAPPVPTVEEPPVVKQEETHVALGMTTDYIRHEFDLIRHEMINSISNNMDRLEGVVRVMEEREREKTNVLQDLMTLNRELRRQNKELIQILDNATSPKGK